MTARRDEAGILDAIFGLSSLANVLGGITLLVLVVTGVITDPPHPVPVIAVAIGAGMLVQGIFSAGYVQNWWEPWGDLASGALLAGQLISAVAGVATLAYAILYVPRAANGGVEPGPFFSGALILVNALLGLLLLWTSGALTRPMRARGAP